jgi:hypothetical protein
MNSNIRSLCSKEGSKTRWYPIPIETWENALADYKVAGATLIPEIDLRKNLAYNLQFVQYLQQTLNELNLSSVLVAQTYKSYVIFAGGIVESLLFFLNRSIGGRDKKFRNVIERLKEGSLFGADPLIYSELDWVRLMRNKVHLQELKDDLGTDYTAFNLADFQRMKKILKLLMATPVLGAPQTVISQLEFLD